MALLSRVGGSNTRVSAPDSSIFFIMPACAFVCLFDLCFVFCACRKLRSW
jgi:hypothetical protein